MKKNIKIILVIVGIILSMILVDSLQAKIFNNSPIIHIRKYYNDLGNLYCIDDGILVRHYKFRNGNQQTIFNWEKVLF